jgi:hypothetical protein
MLQPSPRLLLWRSIVTRLRLPLAPPSLDSPWQPGCHSIDHSVDPRVLLAIRAAIRARSPWVIGNDSAVMASMKMTARSASAWAPVQPVAHDASGSGRHGRVGARVRRRRPVLLRRRKQREGQSGQAAEAGPQGRQGFIEKHPLRSSPPS